MGFPEKADHVPCYDQNDNEYTYSAGNDDHPVYHESSVIDELMLILNFRVSALRALLKSLYV